MRIWHLIIFAMIVGVLESYIVAPERKDVNASQSAQRQVASVKASAPTGKPAPATISLNSDTSKPGVKFDGFSPAGNALDAKSMGFTECSSDYYGATCWNRRASLLNIPAAAFVYMHLESGQSLRDLSKLHYDNIKFSLPRVEYKQQCPKGADLSSLQCDEDGPTLEFQRKLISLGWRFRERRSWRDYYHPAYAVVITVSESGTPGPDEGGVELRAEDMKIVQSYLDEIKKRQDREREAVSSANEFKRKMAQP